MAQEKIIKSDTKGGVIATKSDLVKISKLEGLSIQNNKIIDGCDNPIKAKIYSVNLGKGLDKSKIISAFSSCYGMTGGHFVVVDNNNQVLMEEDAAAISILKTKHDGVNDISLGMQGDSQPVWAWNASQHKYTFLQK